MTADEAKQALKDGRKISRPQLNRKNYLFMDEIGRCFYFNGLEREPVTIDLTLFDDWEIVQREF